MFSSAAHLALRSARRTVFATVSKQARFFSVSTVSSTKHFYTESVLLSEKPNKSAKAKRSNDKKFEQSQLYPNEFEKVGNYNLIEEFDLLMDDDDDKTPPIMKGLRSGKVESVAKKSEAVDKMPSMQETLIKKESVTKKSEVVGKGPPMQEVERSVWPESVARKSEADREVKIHETDEIYFKENDFEEKLSDSDSEDDTEDSFGGFRKRVSNFKVNLDDLKITRLNRRNKFLRDQIEKAISRENGLVFHGEIGGIFALAKMGITPEALFVCSAEVLKYYPRDLNKTALYMIPLEDMNYWVSKMRNPRTAMIGLYKEENLKRKTESLEPEMPLTIICDQIWHRIGFAQIINSVCITPPRLFITSADCVNPWHGVVVRNSRGRSAMLNHNFGLTWEEIRGNVGENDRVYLLELSPIMGYNQNLTEPFGSSLPSVYLYDHSFWDGDNITLVVMGSGGKKAEEDLSRFCHERKASIIDVGVSKSPIGQTAFHMVFFEIRRQWLAAEKRNLRQIG